MDAAIPRLEAIAGERETFPECFPGREGGNLAFPSTGGLETPGSTLKNL
jgi:hypothetical protein